MVNDKITDRLEFLAKKFDIFDTDAKAIDEKISLLKSKYNVDVISDNNVILAIICTKENSKYKNVSISLDVFSLIIGADPTNNKSCVQWMLTTFIRYIKDGQIVNAKQFVIEDLPLANDYITLFEANKRKVKFKEYCKLSYILKHFTDPTDINQYKSLSQLFDAVDPFIVRDPTTMESALLRFVRMGHAEIPVKDRKFTVYIPLTVDASIIFNKFANWCTARPSNSNFGTYTNNLKPNGKKSNLYIIINNKFFTEESDEMYQIHFETNQLKDRNNSSNVNIFESVISQSESLSNYFYEELMGMAKLSKASLDSNKYLSYLVQFGFCESLFEFIDVNAPIIRFMCSETSLNREIPRLPDLSRFKSVSQLIITDAKLSELHPSVGSMDSLEMLILTNNKIKELPREIGNLKNLMFMNIVGNPIEVIPDEIQFLDKSNGGSLFRIALKTDEISDENYKKLKRLLPSAIF